MSEDLEGGLKARIQSDLNGARKARDRERTLVLSTLLSDIKNKEIETGGSLDEAAVEQVISKGIKQRRDAASQMRDAARYDLAEKEEAQAAILQSYLPEQLPEAEVRDMVRSILAEGAEQIGQVMGRLMPMIRGRFDGSLANRIVREELERL